MFCKKSFKILSGIFFISFLTNCTTSSNKGPNGITIYEPDCREIIGLGCKKNLSKNNMQNKSITKGVNKNNKATKSTKIVSKSDAIYNSHAEEHCKKFRKKAKLIQINERETNPLIESGTVKRLEFQKYHEIYKCI